MADTLLSSYPVLTLTHVLGHDASLAVGKLDVSSLGGSGTPGGSATQVQYNTGSGFGGSANLTWDGSKLFTTYLQVATGNTGTGSPGSANTVLHVDGTRYIGTAGGTMLNIGSGLGIGCTNGSIWISSSIGWSSVFDPTGSTVDTRLWRQGAGVLALADLTTAQAYRVYNTITSGTNSTPTSYERGVFDWTTTANTLTIGTQHAGGTLRPVNLVGSALTFNGSPIVGGPGGGGAVVSATPPAFTGDGQLWWENDTGAFHVEYSSAWVAVTPVPAALTRTNDTNVTLTLGGTPGTALAQPVSLTLGWTGTLSTARGGTGQASYIVGDLLYASSTTLLSPLAGVATGNALISGGAALPPAWGKVGNAHIAPMPKFTIKANNNPGTVPLPDTEPTDLSIAALTTKATPTVADWLLLSDTAAAGELKKIAWTAGGGPGGGAPGGSATELQYRIDGSTFGAMAGTVWDNTNRSLTMTGVAVTTSKPVLDLSQEWNAGGVAFTGLKFNVTNTASAAGSMLLDCQVGGATRAGFHKDGHVVVSPAVSPYYLLYLDNARNISTASGGSLKFGDYVSIFTNNITLGLHDVAIGRVAAGLMDVHSNNIPGDAAYLRLNGTTISALPAASATYKGARGTVTDCTVSTFFTTLAVGVNSGGSLTVPAFCTGTVWVIA